jgi:flagellar biosynthetic protein FliP
LKRFALAFLVAALTLALAGHAHAQSVSIDLGGGGSSTGRIVQLVVLVTVLSLAPAILVMVTSFTRIVVVLSFLRSALGTQQAPPNMVLVSLALFLTGFVMSPVFEKAWHDGVQPLIDNRIDETEAFTRTAEPFRTFMMTQVRNDDLALFAGLARSEQAEPPPADAPANPSGDIAVVPYTTLVPAFMISELRRAFEIGFLIFLPFLIIDMVVSSILMSMGMMMLPPVMVSLPFKLIFFVLVDGWQLVAGSLIQSFGTVGG